MLNWLEIALEMIDPIPGKLISRLQPVPDARWFRSHAPAKDADLVYDAGGLADQGLSHAVHRLKVRLIGGLGRNELHRRTLRRFGNQGSRTFIPLNRGERTRAGPGIVAKPLR
jgi:hypothetical protein